MPPNFRSPKSFDRFIRELESYYTPRWSVYSAMAETLRANAIDGVNDYGCGTGLLAEHLDHAQTRVLVYNGFDIDSKRIRFAATRKYAMLQCKFTSSLSEFQTALIRNSKYALILSFCLHDLENLREIIYLINTCSPRLIIAWDLTPKDLPRLTGLLQDAFGRRLAEDPREQLHNLSRDGDLLASYRLAQSVQRHKISFPTAEAVLCYIVAFNLLQGSDMGLQLKEGQAPLSLVANILGRQSYPFVDVREFGCITAQRTSA